MERRPTRTQAEAERLESLWGGSFGTEYSERNASAGAGRRAFWERLLNAYPVNTVLEVGCNVGANLRWVGAIAEPSNVFGVDVNRDALAALRRDVPSVNAVWGLARSLPFRDSWFDLVFTTGVLIHQPEETVEAVMAEVVRTSKRYVLCGEYYAERTVAVDYRGEKGALFKRDYGSMYLRAFPSLRLREQGFLGRDEGWDEVTWWLFEKIEGRV